MTAVFLNRKILLSLGAIVFVAALAMTSTGAFFSDTETSTGNTFTAGAIDLTVDSQQHYNNAVCVEGLWQLEQGQQPAQDQYPVIGSACDGTWTATNLGPQHHFFNFGDVKPGDKGEDTVSLHIDNNPAWACMDIGTNANNENGINNPESKAGDVTANGPADGELAQNIHVIGWNDNGAGDGGVAGDNIWQVGEPQLFASTPLSGFNATTTLTLADGGTGTPLPGGSTSYVGLYWCAGTITGGAGNLGCDGSVMDNQSQTDSATSTVAFRVEQSRNNSTFRCTPQVAPETATVTLDKVVTFTSGAIEGVDVNDYTLHLVGPGGDHILVDQVAMAGLTPGVYTVSEVYSGNPAGVTSTAVFSGGCTEIGTTDTATMNVVAGVNPTCVITNSVSPAIN